jgi:heme-degrading monooxygenase HmoA
MHTKRVTSSSPTTPWLLITLTAFASAGCADEARSGTEGEPAADAFAHCSSGVLESDRGDDLALTGPGVDPKTGRLAAGNYLVSTTYLALEPERTSRALELSGPVIQTLFEMKGFVAFSTSQSNDCAALRTLTIWESEEDMVAFVVSPAHRAAMSEVAELSRGTSKTLAWEGSEKDATWERAASYLAAEPGGYL